MTELPDRDETIERVRALSGVASDRGPDDQHLWAAIQGFVERFHFWYLRVMRGAVGGYRKLIIERINPFIRRMEFRGMSPTQVAARLVEDYDQRNFVTAGGWALEAMAIAASPDGHKSAATGIDMERVLEGEHSLYVLKSGPVTRNSDIVNALKRHAKKAKGLLRQQRQGGEVRANYAVLAGKVSSTFHDGVWRPSSAEFWSEILGLEAGEAIELAMAIASVPAPWSFWMSPNPFMNFESWWLSTSAPKMIQRRLTGTSSRGGHCTASRTGLTKTRGVMTSPWRRSQRTPMSLPLRQSKLSSRLKPRWIQPRDSFPGSDEASDL